MPCSLGAKPEPATVMVLPGMALAWFTVVPALTVKLTSGVLAAWVVGPLAWTVWMPAGEFGTVKVPVQEPWALALIPVPPADVPSQVMVIPLSLAAKPAPVTVAELPGARWGWSWRR